MPLALSAALHAGAGAGFVVGGHGGIGARVPPAPSPSAVELDVASDAPAPPSVRQPVNAPGSPERTRSTHTHDYAVRPSHDAHPHDPTIVHPHAPAVAELPPPASVASGAPAALPRFAVTLGQAPFHAEPIHGGVGRAMAEGAPAAAAEPPVAESAVSEPARLVVSAPVRYPAEARAAEREATVALEIVVDTSGLVVDARVLGAAVGAGFDEAALAAVRGYRFTPARRDGRPVRVRMRWSVRFELR